MSHSPPPASELERDPEHPRRLPAVRPAPARHPAGGYAVCAGCSGALLEGEPAAELEDGRLEHAACWLHREGLPMLRLLTRELLELRGELEELRERRGLRGRARRVLELLRGRT